MTSDAPFTPVAPDGIVLGDEVYDLLGSAILDGRLQPGQRLRDVELATWLGVSRTPVREALQRLERAGLVEVSPNRYTRVSVPSPESHRDMNEFVGHMVGSAVRLAVVRATDEELATAVGQAEAMVDASRSDDAAALVESSTACFRTLTYAMRNRTFETVLREARLAIRRNLAGWRPAIDPPEARTAAYERFRDALAARDGGTAEATVRALHGFS